MKFGTLQVYPRQGLLKEHGLDLPSALIGRGEGSNIHIDDFSISRRHARLTVDSGRLLVEDLGSVAGTFVDGERLEPGVRHLVEESATLRFGEIEARYIPAAASGNTQAAVEIEEAEFVAAGGLRIAVASPGVPIEPGKVAAATLVVANRGRIIDNVRIEIPDLPADWYTIDSPSFAILPGGRADVKVSIHPPRRHDSLAGDYTFTAVVRSQEYDEHPEAEGSFQVLPFESAAISLEAIRSKRQFRLVAENHGNDVARYELSGRDDEQIFKYAFETPAIELQPGEKRIIALAVRRPRQLFGPPQQPPFEVLGKSGSGGEITARGQLSIRPPLQKFRMPVMFSLAAMVLLVVAVAVLVITDGSGTKSANAEDPFDGVHLCTDSKAKEDQAKKNAEAANDKPLTSATVVGPYDGGRPIFGQTDKNGAPFFAQNDARWATEEYARSTELPNGKDWCGTTLAQCGCAMTSVSVMLALYDILQMPGGEPLNPKTLNDWFNGAARKTDRGWVSRGYIYGDVIWSAANELSGEIAKTNPNARTVRFVRTGSGSEDDIRGELTAGRPVLLEVPGHWIAAVGLDEDGTILINDPFYRDRKTLDAYKGKVRSSVHYEPSSDLSSVVITAPADVKFKITDKQGRVVNTGDGTIEQPADSINQIPGASVAKRAAWRDPTCIEKAPPTGAGTNQVVLPGSRDDYVVEILGTGSQPGAVAIHTYGRDGASSIATIEGEEGTKAEIGYDPNASKPVINITSNGTPQATTTPSGGGAAGGDDETPTPAPSATRPPAPTSTPFVEQRTAMTLPAEPGQSRVEVATNSGFELGDPIRFAPGLPNEEDNIIVGFGSFILATPLKFAHSPGEPITRLQRPPGQGPGLPPGITPPPSTGPIEPPKEVVMACSTIYQPSPKLATLICDLQVTGGYTTTRWTLNGKIVNEFSGSSSLIMTFPGDTPANVSATVCNVTLCRSTSRNEAVQFPLAGGGTGTGGTGTGGTGTGTGVAPTPAAGQVTITCGTAFDQTKNPAVANISCQANFSGDFTSISWSAPGGKPANASGQKKTFETQLVNDLGAPTTVKITATVCNFGTCRTSNPLTVGIGQTKTIVDSEPKNPVTEAREVHQRHSVTLFAAVVGLNGIVPQGGNVQFYADNNAINPSAALFTVGSTSVAQVTIETGSRAGLTTIGTHKIFAVYSGGINAFGSTSLETDLEVLPPLPDSCDSVDEDGNDVIDDFTTGGGDASCDITVPRNLGGGTVLNSLTISNAGLPGTYEQDGAPNAVVVGPGQPLSVTGTVGRTEYCPGCIRQVYLGIAGYDTQAPSTKIGPSCVYTGGMPAVPAVVGTNPVPFNAPTVPGVYYLRATTTLDYFCVGPAVGPPDRSVGRIVVKGPVIAQLAIHAAASTSDINPWDDALGPAVSSVEAGKKLIVLAKVPPGATGRVDIQGVGGAALSAPVCPPSGQLTIPLIQPTPIGCTPGEARAMTPMIAEDATTLLVRGRYEDSFPPQLSSPQTNNAEEYPFYESPPQTNPGPYPPGPANPSGWSGSNVVQVKVLLTPSVTLTASPGLPANPVKMGQSFTLTATVAPATPLTPPATASALGGTVQFWAGANKIGGPVPVALVGPNEQASINWTPRDCGGTKPACVNPNEGFPFDTQDQIGAANSYSDVHAEYITGGNADLKSGTSADLDIDIDPAVTETNITNISIPSPSPIGTAFTVTATVDSPLNPFPPGVIVIPPKVEFYADTSLLQSVTLTEAMCPQSGSGWKCTATTTSIATGDSGNIIQRAATYDITATFAGTSQLAPDPSSAQSLEFAKRVPALTVQMPATQPVDTSAVIRAELTGAIPNALDNNGARIFFKHNGSTLVGGTQDVTLTLPGGGIGAEFNIQNLNAGTYNMTVEYEGNTVYEPITCTPSGTEATAPNCPRTLALVIDKHTPTVTLNSVPAVQVGENLTISGSVSGSGLRTPAGGTVSVYSGGTSGTLLNSAPASLSSGNFSITVPTGSGGFPNACPDPDPVTPPNPPPCYTNIVAHFNGDATNGNLNAADSSAGSVTLTKRNSTVTVTKPTTVTVLGDPVALEATVAAASTPASAVSVDCLACLQFQVDVAGTWTDLDVDRDVSSGKSTLSVSTTSGPLAANGTYSIKAVYADPGGGAGKTTNGHANYNPDESPSFSVTVGPPPPTVSLANATMPLNGSTTLTATVTPPSGRVPTCSNCLQFQVEGPIGTWTTFATVSVTEISSGSLTYHAQTSITGGSTAFLSIASYSVRAVYAPSGGTGGTGTADDVGGPATSPSASVTVTARTVTVSISAGASVTLGATAITLTATLSPSAAPGFVKFFADGVEVSGTGGVAADTTDGTTTFSWSPTSVGGSPATISATYDSSDDTNYADQAISISNDDVVINPAVTTLDATGVQTGGAGSSITLTANLTSLFGVKADIDGGSVTFALNGSCSTLAAVTVTDGVATLTGVTCNTGTRKLTATYTGAGNYAASVDSVDFDIVVT